MQKLIEMHGIQIEPIMVLAHRHSPLDVEIYTIAST